MSLHTLVYYWFTTGCFQVLKNYSHWKKCHFNGCEVLVPCPWSVVVPLIVLLVSSHFGILIHEERPHSNSQPGVVSFLIVFPYPYLSGHLHVVIIILRSLSQKKADQFLIYSSIDLLEFPRGGKTNRLHQKIVVGLLGVYSGMESCIPANFSYKCVWFVTGSRLQSPTKAWFRKKDENRK